jgi:hypothetical protein
MPKFSVDVKAFFAFEVEAATSTAAQRVAEQFIEDVMSATPDTVAGYNHPQAPASEGLVVPSHISAGIDGDSAVELADDSEDEAELLDKADQKASTQ